MLAALLKIGRFFGSFFLRVSRSDIFINSRANSQATGLRSVQEAMGEECTRNESRRVGTVFDVPKVEYSKEMHSLIRELLRESRLSMLNKKKVKESIMNGEPLPVLQRPASAVEQRSRRNVLVRPKTFCRRSQELILRSGAYDIDSYEPTNYKFNNDVEKERLQSLMAYGEVVSQKKVDARKRKLKPRVNVDPLSEETDDERFLKLLDGITERLKFLDEMEQFGKGKQYKFTIGQEIAARFRLMKQIDPARCASLDKYQILKTLMDSTTPANFFN